MSAFLVSIINLVLGAVSTIWTAFCCKLIWGMLAVPAGMIEIGFAPFLAMFFIVQLFLVTGFSYSYLFTNDGDMEKMGDHGITVSLIQIFISTTSLGVCFLYSLVF